MKTINHVARLNDAEYLLWDDGAGVIYAPPERLEEWRAHIDDPSGWPHFCARSAMPFNPGLWFMGHRDGTWEIVAFDDLAVESTDPDRYGQLKAEAQACGSPSITVELPPVVKDLRPAEALAHELSELFFCFDDIGDSMHAPYLVEESSETTARFLQDHGHECSADETAVMGEIIALGPQVPASTDTADQLKRDLRQLLGDLDRAIDRSR